MMKLLLAEFDCETDVGLIHTIYQGSRRRTYTRRRGYPSATKATQDYFNYLDAMTAVGYSCQSVLGVPWHFEVYCGSMLVETVSIDWPSTNWVDEALALLGG